MPVEILEYRVNPSAEGLERRNSRLSHFLPGDLGRDFAPRKEGDPKKVGLITGAGNSNPIGIGLATGLTLVKRGLDRVVFTSTGSTPEKIEQAYQGAHMLADEGAEALWLGVDHRLQEHNVAVVARAFQEFKQINYFVGMAGRLRIVTVKDETVQDLRDDVSLMLISNIEMTQALMETALRTRTIRQVEAGVFGGSMMAHLISGYQRGYAPAKAGLEGLASQLAGEFGKYCRWNVIHSGYVRTEMTRSLQERDPEGNMAREKIAAGRIAEPQEIANVVAFLLSPQSSYINGTAINVDGGMKLTT